MNGLPTVGVGDTVDAGDKIGEVGGSGNGNKNTYGPHLHLQINNGSVNPDPNIKLIKYGDYSHPNNTYQYNEDRPFDSYIPQPYKK